MDSHEVARCVVLPPPPPTPQKRVIYIDTEGKFSTQRLTEMALACFAAQPPPDGTPAFAEAQVAGVLARVLIQRPQDAEQLMRGLHGLPTQLDRMAAEAARAPPDAHAAGEMGGTGDARAGGRWRRRGCVLRTLRVRGCGGAGHVGAWWGGGKGAGGGGERRAGGRAGGAGGRPRWRGLTSLVRVLRRCRAWTGGRRGRGGPGGGGLCGGAGAHLL